MLAAAAPSYSAVWHHTECRVEVAKRFVMRAYIERGEYFIFWTWRVRW